MHLQGLAEKATVARTSEGATVKFLIELAHEDLSFYHCYDTSDPDYAILADFIHENVCKHWDWIEEDAWDKLVRFVERADEKILGARRATRRAQERLTLFCSVTEANIDNLRHYE